MKRIFTFLISILVVALTYGQNPVPNPSFYFWTGSVPTSWLDLNGGGTISQSTPGYDANPAVKGSVVVSGPTYTPWLSTDTVGGGFAVTQQYTYLRFYYKLNLAVGGGGQDIFKVSASIKNSTGGSAGYLNPGQTTITGNATNWTGKQIQIVYTGTAAKVNFNFTVQPTGADPYAHLGTYFIIDSVSLTNSALIGINEIEENSILNIYPNPVKSTLNFEIPATQSMKIRISDAIGNVVLQRNSANPVNGLIKEAVNVESLSSGVYFLMLTSDKKTILRRLIVE